MNVSVLSVGDGDITLSFDKNNPAERIRAARVVKDMLRRGYALLVEVEPGKFQRAHDFDEERCVYHIVDFDPLVERPQENRVEQEVARQEQEEPQASSPAPVRKRGRPSKRAIPAESARAVAVGRTAGG